MNNVLRKTLKSGIRLHQCVYITALLFILTAANAFGGTTYYASPSGDNSNSGTSRANAWRTLSYASQALSGGDTLIIMDGTYYGRANMIQPTSGTQGNYTLVKAENDWQVTIDGNLECGQDGEAAISLINKQYIQIEGLNLHNPCGSGILLRESSYIKIKRVGIFLGSISSEHGARVEGSHHVLLEDCWVSGGMRFGFHAGNGTYNVIFRRCVVRIDSSIIDQPIAGIVWYYANDSIAQNCIVLDTNKAGRIGTRNPYLGGFERVRAIKGIKIYASISLNVLDGDGGGNGVYSDLGTLGGGDNNLVDTVSWGNYMGEWHSNDLGTSLTNRCTFGESTRNGGVGVWTYSPGPSVENSLFIDTYIAQAPSRDYNHFSNPSYASGSNSTTGNPNLMYLPVTPLIGTGKNGENQGATIMYRYGRDGTLWGETGYDKLQNGQGGEQIEYLWPFPNEDKIKADFSRTNVPQARSWISPSTNDTKRGFCSDLSGGNPGDDAFIPGALYANGNGVDRTLTSYIWEYLGNECPSDGTKTLGTIDNICGEVAPDTTPPGDVTITNVKTLNGKVEFTWTNPVDADYDGVLIKSYVFDTVSNVFPETRTSGDLVSDVLRTSLTPNTFTHSSLTNGRTYNYSFFTHDMSGNYSVAVNRSVSMPASDTASPYISGKNPASGAVGISEDTSIVFDINDDWSGVKDDSLVVNVTSGAENVVPSSISISCNSVNNPNSCTVTFTPSNSLQFGEDVSVAIDVQDNAGNLLNYEYSFTVLALDPLLISANGLYTGAINTSYSAVLSGSGGMSPYSWGVNGFMPTGLTINQSNGTVYGIPTVLGNHSFTVVLNDSVGNTTERVFVLSVRERLARVESGLVSLYLFDTGSGNTVRDQSGVSPAMDLTIGDTTRAAWIGARNGIDISSSTIISNPTPTKLSDTFAVKNQITIEAWVAPANTMQYGPARIVTLSQDPSNRNFTLGQTGDSLEVRLRTPNTSLNGTPALATPSASLSSEIQHVVCTYDGSIKRLYVDGVEISTQVLSGGFSNWDSNYTFALGNEIGNVRMWLGKIYLVAIYSQALTQTEVTQNYDAGSRISLDMGDVVGPSGTVTVNDTTNVRGADYMGVNPASITLEATDAEGLVVGWLASETNTAVQTNDSRWVMLQGETFPLVVNFTLSDSDGEKHIYVWFKDDSGNVGSVTSATFILDTTYPFGTINIPLE